MTTAPPIDPIVQIAITVRLPWAAAIRSGRKLVENRGRPIPAQYIGRRFGLHVAAAWSKEGATDPRIATWWWGPSGPHRRLVEPADFPFMARHVVAVGRLAGCHLADQTHPSSTCCPPWGDRNYVDQAKAAWHIEFADVVPLAAPVGPIIGSLGVPWPLKPEDAKAISDRYLDAP